MKELIQRCVEVLRRRHVQGDATAATECIDRFGMSIHRRVRHMARTGRFDGELGEFAERALRHLSASLEGPREDVVREASRLTCVAMIESNIGMNWETMKRPADATVVCA